MAVALESRKDDTFWLPGEICLVFHVIDADQARARADALVGWLNGEISPLLSQSPSARPSLVQPAALQEPLGRDLDRSGLRDRFGATSPLLAPRHDVVLRRQLNEAEDTMLFFVPLADVGRPSKERRDDVEQLARLINWELLDWTDVRIGNPRPGPRRVPDDVLSGCTLHAATPNWLTAIANGASGDSPGSKPKEAPDGNYHIEILIPIDWCQVLSGAGDDVLVAVLDTCPLESDVRAAAGRDEAAGNHLLQTLVSEIGGQFRINPALPIPPQSLSRVDDYMVNLRNLVPPAASGPPGHEYEHTDHGLFVAGVVRDVARDAEIDLIRVLNNFGVGDLDALAGVIAQLPALREQRGKAHLIVNLSLGAEAWPGHHLLHYWLQETYDALVRLGLEGALESDVERALAGYPAILGMLIQSHLSLEAAIGFVVKSGALVVAAAGNDYDDKEYGGKDSPRQEPRFPARYESALGVAAVDIFGGPSDFSNRSDGPDENNGIATFGGQAHRGNAGDLPEIGPHDTGIIGICSSPDLPLEAPPKNGLTNNGWVTWAGTSFSTPIISGLCARYWSSPTFAVKDNETVKDAVRTLGGATNAVLSSPVIRAFQSHTP